MWKLYRKKTRWDVDGVKAGRRTRNLKVITLQEPTWLSHVWVNHRLRLNQLRLLWKATSQSRAKWPRKTMRSETEQSLIVDLARCLNKTLNLSRKSNMPNTESTAGIGQSVVLATIPTQRLGQTMSFVRRRLTRRARKDWPRLCKSLQSHKSSLSRGQSNEHQQRCRCRNGDSLFNRQANGYKCQAVKVKTMNRLWECFRRWWMKWKVWLRKRNSTRECTTSS